MKVFIVLFLLFVLFVFLARKFTYFKNMAISFDQLFNTLLRGDPDETLSSRAWRLHRKQAYWYSSYPKSVIDMLFLLLGQKNHCYNSFVSECMRKHLDEEFIDEKWG